MRRFIFKRDLTNVFRFQIVLMQSQTVPTAYPSWVMSIGVTMIAAGILPIPAVYLLRRFQILTVDLDIHQGSIRRNETTASTKQMMDEDDVSEMNFTFWSEYILWKKNVRTIYV